MGLLTKLQTLNLGLNQLNALPGTIGNLQELCHLGLSDNRFTRAPGCLARLEKLQKVNLDRNPLTLTPEQPQQDIIPVTAKHYMVTENLLCDNCLKKCQSERSKLQEAEEPEQDT